MIAVVYLLGAYFVVSRLGLGAYLIREYLRAGESERRALARPLVVGLLHSTSIMLIGIIVLLAGAGTVPPSGLVFAGAALVLTASVLRWRWRKSFPQPRPEAEHMRRRLFSLTLSLGIVLFAVQGVLLLRYRGLSDETPIWPAGFGFAFLLAALIYYLQGRSKPRGHNSGSN